jgi:hypothetical protein
MSAPRHVGVAVRGALALALAGALVAAVASAQPTPAPRARLASGETSAPDVAVDEARAGWALRRAVNLTAAEGLAAIALDPELLSRAAGDQRDLRLLDGRGRERPYVVVQGASRPATEFRGRMIDARQERRDASVVVVDLDELRELEAVRLDVAEGDFAKRLRIDASQDANAWFEIAGDASVFERPWGAGRVRSTEIRIGRPVQARYLRIGLDDRRSRPITLRGVTGIAAPGPDQRRWEREVALEPLGGTAGTSRYRIEIDPAAGADRLRLDADDAAFFRRARVVAEARDGRTGEARSVGQADLYRVRVEELGAAAEALEVAITTLEEGRSLVLELHDQDSPPLRRPRAIVSGPQSRLVFPVGEPGPLWLYYGNPMTRAPLYDLGSLRGRLRLAPAAETLLGAETANPRHRSLPPLAVAPVAGAPVEADRFPLARRLTIGAREDIFALDLHPDDLRELRADLGDLRLEGPGGLQIPFLLESGVAESGVALSVEPERAAAKHSRFRLALPAGRSVGDGALPASALELEVAPAFFSRRARIEGTLGDGGERRLYDGTLTQRADPGSVAAPLRIGLSGARVSGLVLDVDDGDDAPLSLRAVRLRVATPRVVFKARPGEARVLLGRPDLASPRYDIAALRQELLAYSATRVVPGPLEPNASYRRRAGELLRLAPGPVLLWLALGGAVLALGALVVRALRASE